MKTEILQNPTPTTPLRVALLGTGVIAAPHALALQSTPGVEIVAVCDRERNKAIQFQQTWKIPQAYDSVDDMFAGSRPDVVHVLLPPAAHAAEAIRCLEQGAHVFIEKPFCLTSQECESVEKVASRMRLQVGVNHNLTYMPGCERLIQEVQRYRLGALQHVNVTYNLPVPIKAGPWMFGSMERLILELGPHPISVIVRLLGSIRSASTAVSGERMLSNGEIYYGSWLTSLVCERGTAQMMLSLEGEYKCTAVHALGQDGECYVDLRRNTVRISEKGRLIRMDNLQDAWSTSRSVLGGSLANFRNYTLGALGIKPTFELQNISMLASIGAFYRALISGRPVPVGSAEGSAVVDGCEKIIENARCFIENGVGQIVIR